jgi:DNA-binding Lrp family transcriptional regulator
MAGADELDTRLIAILRRDGRRAISDLALDLGVSRATVRARLERLTRDGIVQGFTVVLRDGTRESPIRAIMQLAIEGKREENVRRKLAGLPETAAIYSTNGRWDLIVELAAPDLASFDRVLSRIRMIDGIASSETSLLLARHGHDNRFRDRMP